MLLLVMALAPALGAAHAQTFVPISGQMGIGASGSDVINLQTFLASNPYMYPEGIVSGYYGNLTANAVARFQSTYGISAIGRVGPATLGKINNLIATGYGIDISAPMINNLSWVTTKNSAGISWNTSEMAKGKVYYSEIPLQVNETNSNFAEPSILSSVAVIESPNIQSSQSVTIPNLQSNKVYYYMIVATDVSGNVTVTVPSSFVTNP